MSVRSSLKSKKHFYVPYNGKIADITHADTNAHNLTGVSALLSDGRKIVSLLLRWTREAGTGVLRFFPNSGTQDVYVGTGDIIEYVLADGTDTVKYMFTVANDDFDLYCLGYVVET